MSAVDLLEAEELVSEPVSDEPAMWRNWWRAPHDGIAVDQVTGQLVDVKTGDVFPGSRVFPSAEQARDAAQESIARRPLHYEPLIWLGAHPVGSRP